MNGYHWPFLNVARFDVAAGRAQLQPHGVVNHYHINILFYIKGLVASSIWFRAIVCDSQDWVTYQSSSIESASCLFPSSDICLFDVEYFFEV